MQIRKNDFLVKLVSALLLLCMVGCNANFEPGYKDTISESSLKSVVSDVIDAQMEYIKPYLDEELQEQIDNPGTRGSSQMTGRQIIDKTLDETGGRDYLDFCYSVVQAQNAADTSDVLETAKCLLSAEDYNKLCEDIEENTRKIEKFGAEAVRGIPLSQQEAFYKDLKVLVVRSIVMLTAGIVYAVVPQGVFWGKVSAAAAISVGAGLVAATVMTIYERYKFGAQDPTQSFDDWLDALISVPKADYALAASAIAIGETFEKGPIVTGIVVVVFALYKAADAIHSILNTYNFDA